MPEADEKGFHINDLLKDNNIKTESDPVIPISTDCEGALYCRMGYDSFRSLVSIPYEGGD